MHCVEVRDPNGLWGGAITPIPAWLRYGDPATALPDGGGSITAIPEWSHRPITGWRHYGDPRLAPLRRSWGGSFTPIPEWLHMGDR